MKYRSNAVEDSLACQWPRSFNSATVVIWAPRPAVDVNMLWVKTKRRGFHSINRTAAAQCSDSCNNGLEAL